MKSDKMFRTCLFGGYNKEDVQSYIERLEQEIERLTAVEATAELLEKSVDELLEKQRADQAALEKIEAMQNDTQEPEATQMDREEMEVLKEKAQKYEESYDAIKQLLLDSRIEAQVILTDARQQAEKLREQMESEAKMQYDQTLLEAEEAAKKTRAAAEEEINEEKKAVREEQLEAERALQDARKQAAMLIEDAENRIAKRRRESIAQVDKAFAVMRNQLHAILLQAPEEFEHAVEAEFSRPVLEENSGTSDTVTFEEEASNEFSESEDATIEEKV